MNFENETEKEVEQFVAKNLCEQDHLFFTRYFFRQRNNMRFLVNWHHGVVARAVQRVFDGETEILVINVPPGSSKTELVVINLIARGLAINPRARFLHLSYSDDLALLNSATARDLVQSDEYQYFWPLQIADDSKSKKRWNVMVDGKTAGGVYATSLGGQITGFRAGHMEEGFQGAIIIDDPLKPEDAFSKTKVDAANRKLLTTVKSRKARSTTPIILIMQRLAEHDPSAFLLNGALGKRKLEHVKIPAMVDDEYIDAHVPEDLKPDTSELESDERGRFSYWPGKEPLADLLALERGEGVDSDGARISRHVYAGQYGQDPVALGGNLIKGSYFPRYKVLPQIRYRLIYADTASKIKKRNDYSVFEEWGMGKDNRLYLIDMIRGKWEAPELQNQAIAFWAKVKARDVEKYGQARGLRVEDKSSGTGLIQTLKAPPYSMPMKDIQRDTDKLQRCNDGLPYMEAGLVVLPLDAPFTADFVAECEAFTADDSHAFDDQIDPMLDAIKDNLASGNKLKTWAKLGAQSAA